MLRLGLLPLLLTPLAGAPLLLLGAAVGVAPPAEIRRWVPSGFAAASYCMGITFSDITPKEK